MMKKFSNAANLQLAYKLGSKLIAYNHNGESLRERAIDFWKQGRTCYYENTKPTKQHPAGSSYLYEVNNPK